MISEKELLSSLQRCRGAALELRALDSGTKNRVLLELARLLKAKEGEILKANAKDLEAFDSSGSGTSAFRDRLLLDSKRIEEMAESLRQVAALVDPVGETVETKILANGLKLRRVRSPLGVIFMIFESRPNVAVEAFSLAFKSGNVIILRGGKESQESASAIYRLIREAFDATGVDPDSMWGITDSDRSITQFLLQQRAFIDVVVPRGGEALIDYVVKNSAIPIIKHDRGLCHVFVNEDADWEMALEIVENAKAQRPSACNAMETLLVHSAIAAGFIPRLYERLKPFSVHWYGCPETLNILDGHKTASAAIPESWDTEYLDFKMNCRVVGSLGEAIAHIEQHGSRHSESIVTASEKAARHFQDEIDAAAVFWNASTRFTDGFEMGLGGELGISTQKLHVRGPVGLKELTSVRWIGDGTGQVRK